MKFTTESLKGNKNNFVHGMSAHILYITWSQMKQRCNNPKRPKYPLYGGRGIKVCPEWECSFVQFLHDMGERPAGYTLGRIDNDKDYSKDNCEWQSYSDQNRNHRPYKRNA